MKLLQPYIAGQSYPSSSETFESINPANGMVVAEIVNCGIREVDDAVFAARTAQREWAKLSAPRRGELVMAWGDLIAKHADEIIEMDISDMGKVISDARGDMMMVGRMTRYWGGMADKLWGDQIPVTPGHLSYTVREAVGVCAIILPWNGPAITFVSRVSMAISCGNAVVVKPSELSPQSALRLAQLSVEAGLPKGLINVLPGNGETGKLLTIHSGIDAVSFTGSVDTGRSIAAVAAPKFKKLVLELGGKAPNLIFDDANLSEAVRSAVWGVFQNAGQVCCASTRLLLQSSIADEVIGQLTTLLAKVRVGDPKNFKSNLGPVVSERQMHRVQDYIQTAVNSGGQLLSGSICPDDHDCDGFYVPPTVIVGVASNAPIVCEEVFGPVLSVLTFDTEEDAINLANDTEFGLSANVWTNNIGRMLRVAESIDAGVIWGNTARLMDPALGFGGFKNSGIGHATGREAIEGVTRIKRVSLRYGSATVSPAWQ